MLELPLEAATYDALMAELPALDDVEARPPDSARPAPAASARIACWNLERGRHLDVAATLLAATGASAYLLTELDWGMARSGQLHTARELARRLHCGYAYGVEFLELGLGNERERDQHRGESNAVGFHGGAILSPHELARPELVRLERSGRWFDGGFGERRVGGRMALLATLRIGATDVTLASVHLESHSDPDGRAQEFQTLLEAIDAYSPNGPGAPALIAGDINTSSFSREELRDRDGLAETLRDDPGRLLDPVSREPLFAMAQRAGYDWRACNWSDTSTQRTRSGRGRAHLDWFFCRGLSARDPEVIAAVAPGTGAPLSDHELLAVTLFVDAGQG